jgi:hypothetical protein
VAENFYLALTPYHVFLCCGVALARGRGETHRLALIAHARGAEELAETVRRWPESPFREVSVLEGCYGRPVGALDKLAGNRRNLRLLREHFRRFPCDHLFVCNDALWVAQGALHYAKRADPRAKGVYLEDGAFAYHAGRWPGEPAWRMALRRAAYGRFAVSVRVMGTSPWIDETLACFPDAVRTELRARPVRALPRETFRGPAMENLARSCLERLSGGAPQTSDAVLILAFPGAYPDERRYREVLRALCSSAARNGLRLLAKHHPRAPAGDPLGLAGDLRLRLLPQGLPMEFYFLAHRRNLRRVWGDISTALLSARWLLDGAEVVSFAPLLRRPGEDHGFFDLYRRLGIGLPAGLEDL